MVDIVFQKNYIFYRFAFSVQSTPFTGRESAVLQNINDLLCVNADRVFTPKTKTQLIAVERFSSTIRYFQTEPFYSQPSC